MRHLLLAALLVPTPAAATPPVAAVAFAPDGKTLAVGAGSAVTLLDANDGGVRATRPGPGGRVTALGFGADGTLAAAAGEPGKSGRVSLFTPGHDAARVTFDAHKDSVTALAWAPDGRTLATASYDRAVKLWRVGPSGAPTLEHALTDHSDAVYAVAFHPAGRLLATGAADRAVKVWDAGTGKRLYTLSDATDWVHAVAWSPDGTKLVVGGADRSLRVYAADAAGGKLLAAAVAHEKPVLRAFVSPDNARVVSVGEDRVVKVWGLAKLTEQAVSPPRPDAVLAAALSPDGKRVALGRYDGVAELLDAADGSVRAAVWPPKPTLTAVTPAGVVRGEPTPVTLAGTGLDRLTAVTASDPGVTVVLGPPAGGTRRTAMITAAGPVGRVTLTGTSAGGDTGPAPVWVDWFPAVAEPASDAGAFAVALPATIVGTLDRAGDVDTFAVELKAGEELGVHLTTTLGADKFAPVLAVAGADGRPLAEVTGARLGFAAPAAGRYTVSVRDRQFRGGKAHDYRLHAGPVPVVAGVRPLAVARGRESVVTLVGVNLGATREVCISVPADAAIGSRQKLTLPGALTDAAGAVSVAVAARAGVPVAADGTVTLAETPASADGVLAVPGQAHRVRFRAKKGEKVVVEVEADQLGSPVDATLLITDAAGVPVPRAVLRPVAKAFTTFRDNPPEAPGIRLEAWNELAVDDYLYADGELLRIKLLPPTPDDDCQFYAAAGKRAGQLGTTPTAHANGTALFKVEVHPPGRTFPPNGMPVVTLPYRNDDAAGRDAKLVFDPPTDGDYTAVVADAAGAGGPAHGYRLHVRPPAPDFALAVTPSSPAVWAGGGVPLTVTATRTDEFAGPIEVTFEGLPAGLTCPPTRIEAGQLTAVVPLTAAAQTPVRADGPAVPRAVGRAAIDGVMITRVATIAAPTVRTGGDVTVKTDKPEVTIRPGGSARLTVEIARHNGHAARVPVEVRGLPHGVRVIDIGLNGVLITPDRTRREVVIVAEPWVKPGSTPFVVLAKSERKQTEHAAPAVVLKVE